MHVPESLRVLIRAKLAAGRLPHDHLRVSGGPGNGETCVACGEAITTSNLVMRGVSRGLQTLQFHVQCFYVWDTERAAPG